MRILMLGGVAGPALFSSVALVCATLRPHYSHLSSFISELGATGTPHATLMNYAGFVPGGVLLIGFGIALLQALPRNRLTIAGSALVTLFGTGLLSSGFLSCDPGCPQSGGSIANALHDTIGPLSFLSLIVGASIFGVAFRRLPAWRHLAAYSFLTSAVGLGLLIALAASLQTRALTGLWQRLLVVTLFLWCAVVGLRAYRSG